MLVVFTKCKRYGDKYLRRSINQGFIKVPPQQQIIDGVLFIFDDVSPLEIAYPRELVDFLQENNQPTKILNAQDLASDLASIMPESDKLSILTGGGVLTYLFLKRAGYQGSVRNLVDVERTYVNGRPQSNLRSSPCQEQGFIFLDDILASGQTLTTATRSSVANEVYLEFACLLASANVPKGEVDVFNLSTEEAIQYRERSKTTLPKIERFYCAQFVNGPFNQSWGNSKPAILSLRYLLTKAVDNDDYRTSYLARKFGGLEKAEKVKDILARVNREPIDLLRKDPKKFLKSYGMEL